MPGTSGDASNSKPEDVIIEDIGPEDDLKEGEPVEPTNNPTKKPLNKRKRMFNSSLTYALSITLTAKLYVQCSLISLYCFRSKYIKIYVTEKVKRKIWSINT